jgi:hypothetical protein
VTGFTVRIDRGSGSRVYDISELTDIELEEFFANKQSEVVLRWLIKMVGWIRENVETFDDDDHLDKR